ncbi:CHAT domain-containing protein [Streptomyces sp. Ag109_G2-15]|uniref:CHAT domain-containing protein n=1 Tax=Streptomyces sp. Ag109_G2-15 TaxID=1938850 RepID=UPI000BC4A667|nr:CHAT domain-containing tetratricopeptide repeat protein [Streptomyces sp. Ag109_G2-15]SOD86638.1 Tetratricopeptide repeat-containing protein [Streptomyces sp. Ag109_G2-15]
MLDDVERRLFERLLSISPETFGERLDLDPEGVFRTTVAMQERYVASVSGLTAEDFVDRLLAAESPARLRTLIASARLPFVEWVLLGLHRRALACVAAGRPAQARLARLALDIAWEARGTHDDRLRPEDPEPPSGEGPTADLSAVLAVTNEECGLVEKFLRLRSMITAGDRAVVTLVQKLFVMGREHRGAMDPVKLAGHVALSFADGLPESRVFGRLEWMAHLHAHGRSARVAHHLDRLTQDLERAQPTEPPHEFMERIGQRCLEIDLVELAVSAFRAATSAVTDPGSAADGVLWYARTKLKTARGLHRLALAAEALAELEPALALAWDEALASDTASAHGLRAEIRTSLGLLHEELGRYPEGRRCYLEAAEDAEAAGDTQELVTALTYAMASLSKAGRHRSAAHEGYRLLDWAREALLPGYLPAVLNNVGHVLRMAGRDDEATALYREALAVHRGLGARSPQEMHSLFALGDEAERRGDIEEALQRYGEAYQAGESAGQAYRARMFLYRRMAALPQALFRGLLEAAEDSAQQAAVQGDLTMLESALLPRVAVARVVEDHGVLIDTARFLYEFAVETDSRNRTVLRLTMDYADTLRRYGTADDRARAFSLLWSARTHLVDSVRHTGRGTVEAADTRDLRALCSRLLVLLFDHAAEIALPDDRDAMELAFDLHEEAKSLHVLARYARARLGMPPEVPRELADREETLLAELRTLVHRPDDLLGRTPNRGRRVHRIQRELAELHEQIRPFAPSYVSLRESAPATLAQTRRVLRQRGADAPSLVSYYCGWETTWVFEVAPDGTLAASAVPLGREQLSSTVARLQRTFDGDRRSFPQLPPLNGARPWRRSLDFLDTLAPLAGFADRCPDDGLVCVSPDGPLRGLPFHALTCPDSGGYVVARTAVTYTPSISSLLYITTRAARSAPGRVPSAFVAGVPTRSDGDGTCDEEPAEFDDAHLLADAGWEVRGLPAVELTPAEVLDRLGRERVMHLTCHGYYDPDNPLDSGLLLSDGRDLPPAGFREEALRRRLGHVLSVRQILAAPTELDLLTLRACSTARVTESADPDERDGFATALMLSGANAVVATLWDVDKDSSRALLVAFYRRLAENPPAPAWKAFRDAQRLLLSDPAHPHWAHPYHWAGLTLSGDWR